MRMVEVILEEDPQCPRCRALEKVMRKICNELGIPFTVVIHSTRAVAAFKEDSSSHTFDPEWVQRWGLDYHKKKLKKLAPILAAFKQAGFQAFPNLIIRWHDGGRVKEIVINGYDPWDEEKAKQFEENIKTLLMLLLRGVERRYRGA